MLANGEVSEVAFRVLSYWLERESIEQVKQRMQAIELKKYEEVIQMQKLIESNRCMREQLLEYFGQDLEQKQENCCTNCGLDEMKLMKQRILTDEASKMTDWQQR